MRALFIAMALLAATVARADNADPSAEARAHFDKGNAAYALGDYGQAAQEYEKAFSLKPDPALLYNAAQAHRIAGNKPRALLLYQNYLRVFGAQISNRDEVERHIENLQRAIEQDQKAQTTPPTTTLPGTGATAPGAPTPGATTPGATTPGATTPGTTAPGTTAPPLATSAPTLVASAPPAQERSLVKRPWFWATVGGAALVVAGVAIGLGVGLSGDKNPSPTLGAVAGN